MLAFYYRTAFQGLGLGSPALAANVRTHRMIRRIVPLFCLSVLSALALAACGGEPVGRKCDLGLTPGDSDTVVASPSLDCISRTCLKVPLEKPVKDLPPGSSYPTGNLGLCTDRCSADGDCERVPESPCKTGFTCGIPAQVGPFCCEKFCICKDYLVIPDTGVPVPQACDATNAANGCCNLPGRREDPTTYPDCVGK
jgi:hypothetical protein